MIVTITFLLLLVFELSSSGVCGRYKIGTGYFVNEGKKMVFFIKEEDNGPQSLGKYHHVVGPLHVFLWNELRKVIATLE